VRLGLAQSRKVQLILNSNQYLARREADGLRYDEADQRTQARFERDMAKPELIRAKSRERAKEIRAKWGPLKKVQGKLRSELEKKIPGYFWRPEGRLNPRGQAVDIRGVLRSQGYEVYIELERDRATCVLNITKVWMHVVENRLEDVLLIQVFSPIFLDGSRKFDREEAEFVGRKAFEDTGGKLVYMPVVVPSWPSEDPKWYQDLAERIQGLILSE